MRDANQLKPWLINTLLDDGYLKRKGEELAAQPPPYDLDHWLGEHFDARTLAQLSEPQLEDRFIGPMLKQLGWSTVPQKIFIVQGGQAEPDWCLLLQPRQNDALIASGDPALITAICESKAWDKTLDTGKANRKENPHH